MIILTEVARKLENILNGVDEETTSYTRPFDFEFSVKAEGFHLDHIYNKNSGKNFIPVFIESLGGQYDAVPNLKRSTNTIAITIYFPVRFKNQFFAANDFLVNCFVAKKLNYRIFQLLHLEKSKIKTSSNLQSGQTRHGKFRLKTWKPTCP